jgi:Domain of unknown function (DUF5703)
MKPAAVTPLQLYWRRTLQQIVPAATFVLGCCLLLVSVRGQVNNNYNIRWTTPSTNTSASMPCGGGDIGMNVWVENGDLLIYLARSGNFNEDNALFKTGRLRIQLSPNPFSGGTFLQELHLQEGTVTITGEANGIKATATIWADVFAPVAHVSVSSNKKINVLATYESWRYKDRLLQPRENFANSWKWAPPKNKTYARDSIAFVNKGVLFYHKNTAQTIFDSTVAQQDMGAVKELLYNPLSNLIFGGYFFGKNFVPAATTEGVYVDTDFKGWQLKSEKASTNHALQVVLHNQQNISASEWQDSVFGKIPVSLQKNSQQLNQQWWQQFWNRSFIHINSSDTTSLGWQVGRNFQLFRYMLACNASGQWPTKFNGGLLTVDPVFTDSNNKLTPDYRNWGGGLHTMQNQRLVYFPMIKNGDWDLLQPQLQFYLRILKNAELRSKVYWNHAGACFTEQMENYGLPDYAEYGTKRPMGFDKGVEYNAWLEYEWDTVFEFCLMMLEEERYTGKNISTYIPFIESCLRFFDEHYQYLAKQRGIKALDEKGKLVLYPGSGAETFKMATNASSTIAALQTITQRLLQLPGNYLSTAQRAHWDSVSKRIPGISYTSFDGKTTIAPAKQWERVNNTEPVQLYPVYPWGIFGIGKPGLDTALNTWHYDTLAQKFRNYVGWKQDNIWAARLGLAAEAWRLTALKLQNSERRFPAFWGPGFDWVPDHNWGGSGMIGLQEQLLQTDGKRILLFPAWTKDKDVHFKLHAPYNTTVEATLVNGAIKSLIIIPAERTKDVEILLQ